ncbi:ATP-binding protein [Phenylobacterium sp.]|uniref:hybrid sensor histidine kinase/response regulator n=1 Tax=Phenylobacterium sp. TaxID=1871053 RepID=UPI0025FFCCD6|nr:ATP-binding protein [Phenylobacterium sp.]
MLIATGSLLASMAVRGLLIGFEYAPGLSATTFPALIVTTLYAGPRWGWATLAVALGVGLLNTPRVSADLSVSEVLIMFALSAALTVVVCASLREALLQLDEANAARAAARQSIEITETRFRALADSAPILMWVTQTDGRREFANRAYVDFLGVNYQAAIDFDWRKVLHPDDVARVLQEQVAGESSRTLFTLEARYRRRDGDYRWVRSVSQPRWGPDGGFAGFVGVGFDVTDAKRAEDDLKRINDLLAERVEAALSERDEAEAALRRAQKLDAMGQLTGGVAHDFNNLLTVIIGALDLMQRHPGDAVRRDRMIEAAAGAARRAERLTQQLLAFSRRQALKPEPVEIDRLLNGMEPLLRRATDETVTLTIAPDARGAVANLDAGQLEAAIMNLVVNARDAVSVGGAVQIMTSRRQVGARQIEGLEPGDYACVSVRDNGSGMDAATVARAFEPFFTTKPQGRGTGLGLSQVYGFARQSGGSITVESAPGEGSCFSVYLPLVEATPIAHPVEPSPAAGPALRVLLVEDDPQVAELAQAMLEELGHSVRPVGGASDALAILRTGAEVDLLLTDLIMPGDRSGVDLAREAVSLRPDLPVILSSGYTGETLSAAEGAPWPLLRKPYGADQLAHVIAGVLPPV